MKVKGFFLLFMLAAVLLTSPSRSQIRDIKNGSFVCAEKEGKLPGNIHSYMLSNQHPLSVSDPMHPGFYERLSTMVLDFRVSGDDGYGRINTTAFSGNEQGQTVAVWSDARNGLVGIRARILNRGIPAGDSFWVIDWYVLLKFQYIYYDVAVDNDGYVYFIYSIGDDIYAKIVDRNGSFIAEGLKLQDALIHNPGYTPSVDVDNNGYAFAVRGEASRDGNQTHTIYGQYFTREGTLKGANRKLTQDFKNIPIPQVALAETGEAMVIWWMYTDEYLNSRDIYARGFSATGSPVSDSFIVNGSEYLKFNQPFTVCGDKQGNFTVVWNSRGDYPNSKFVLKRYTLVQGGLVGTGEAVFPDMPYFDFPVVAMNRNGRIVLTSDRGSEYVFLENDLSGSERDLVNLGEKVRDAKVYLSPGDSATYFWRRYYTSPDNGKMSLYSQQYDWNGDSLGSRQLVDQTPEGSALRTEPQVAVFGDGGFVVTWADYTTGHEDFYLRCFNNDGSPRGDIAKIVEWDGSFSHLHNHTLSANKSGDVVVTSYHCGGPGEGIIYQRFDKNGIRIGNNIRISERLPCDYKAVPCLDEMGDMAFAWGCGDLFFQYFTIDGDSLSGKIQIDETEFAELSFWFSNNGMVMDDSGRCTVAWYDDRNGNDDVYLQRFDREGTRIGGNVQVNDDAGSADQDEPFILTDGDSLHYILWLDERNGKNEIYAQKFSKDWNKTGDNFLVVNGYPFPDSDTWPVFPIWSMDEAGRVVSVWTSGYDIYGRRFDKNLEPVGDVFVINGAPEAFQETPFVAVSKGNIYTVWSDNRLPNTGMSIGANILD